MNLLVIVALVNVAACLTGNNEPVIINNKTVPVPITETAGTDTTIIPPKPTNEVPTNPSVKPSPISHITSSTTPTSTNVTTITVITTTKTTLAPPAPTGPSPSVSTPNATNPSVLPTVAPHHERKFDGPSFVGGIILALGMMAIAFVALKFYKARTEQNYHTL